MSIYRSWLDRHAGTGKYLRKLLGNTEIEDSLQRLDRLTQEEARMASAESLKVTHNVEVRVRDVQDDVKDVGNNIQNVDGRVQDVQGDVHDIGNNVQDVNNRVQGIGSDVNDISSEVREANSSLSL